jgi:hypothetical protein
MTCFPVHLIDGVLPVEPLGVGEVEPMLGHVLPVLASSHVII